VWEEFKRYLEVLNLSPATVKAYTHTVRLLEELYGDASQVTRRQIVEFLARYPPSSRARHLMALRKLYVDYLQRPEVVAGLSVRVERKPLERWLSLEEVRMLIEAAPPRERAIIRLGYDLALRVGEVVALNRGDVLGDAIRVPVLKKGREERVLKPLYPQTKRALEDYLATRYDALEPLFISRRGRRISVDTVERGFRKLCAELGIELPPRKPAFHILRHSRAAHMREAGVPIDVISRFLNHARLETTMIYAHIGEQRLWQMVPPPEV